MRYGLRLKALSLVVSVAGLCGTAQAQIGSERAVDEKLADGEEFTISLKTLLGYGATLFNAPFTEQDGAGRPQTKGTGAALSDAGEPLVFPRNHNRISAPDANSCGGCHNVPRSGGGGDFVTNVFVLGQRFDFATFDPTDTTPTKGGVDENSNAITLDNIANSRATTSMFGSGYLEMLARQITVALQDIRDSLGLGESEDLVVYGIDYGSLTRNGDDSWDTSAVEGLSVASLQSSTGNPPSLIIRPWHQAGAVVSLREFTNNAMNHHHGMQSTERFGVSVDADMDSMTDELSRADITATTIWQATLPPPGRVIPKNSDVEDAVLLGESKFVEVGCSDCHIPCLPLIEGNWNFVEPNPFNPSGNLQTGTTDDYTVDLNSKKLPGVRLKKKEGITWVPAFTDFKLHDITDGVGTDNYEPLNMHFMAGSTEFNAGNGRFLTKRLWGCANEPPYYHHGKFKTLRQAVEAHSGEATTVMTAYDALTSDEQDAIIEFLKTLQVLPDNAKSLIIDNKGKKKKGWPDFPYDCDQHLPSQMIK